MPKHIDTLLPYTYLGSVFYFRRLVNADRVFMEVHEHFRKQTFRNRCVICGANGPLILVVPTLHESGEHAISKRRISYHENWRKIHWKSLETAYRSSPYFEYYEDGLKGVFDRRYEYLTALNGALTDWALATLGTEASIQETKSYESAFDGQDLRNVFSQKAEPLKRQDFRRYTQVFEERHGFIPNLSIVDLIFNMGPNAPEYL